MSDKKLSHVVFFTLKDGSPENISAMVAACHRYLKDHPGVVAFFAGELAPEYARPVNDRAFHVCLNVVDVTDAARRYSLQFGLTVREQGADRATLACDYEPYSLELVRCDTEELLGFAQIGRAHV